MRGHPSTNPLVVLVASICSAGVSIRPTGNYMLIFISTIAYDLLLRVGHGQIHYNTYESDSLSERKLPHTSPSQYFNFKYNINHIQFT